MKHLYFKTAIISILLSSLFALNTASFAEKAPTKATKATKATKSHKKKKARTTHKTKPSFFSRTYSEYPKDSTIWHCANKLSFAIEGDISRDQIITLYWSKQIHKLPRETTTTGADRFHDHASGFDLIIIPTKAMLFSSKNHERYADECQTEAMRKGGLADTQSVNLLN